MTQGGIFATDGSSAWGTANRAYVKYCSSDLWTGDVAASDATFGWNFRGSRIVAATITHLMDNKGLGSAIGAFPRGPVTRPLIGSSLRPPPWGRIGSNGSNLGASPAATSP